MIPVLAVPILNKPELLQRMFDTIDYGPIDRLFIIDNGGGVVAGNIQRWPTHVNRYEVARPGYNMGVGPSWNHIIKANMNAPWWLIVNNDLRFQPGILQKLVDEVEKADKTPWVIRIAMGNEGWGNHFGAFAINAEAIEQVGWFDENLYPIYFEETLWMRRAEKLEIPMHLIQSTTHHDGNASWKNNPKLAAANKVSWDANAKYYDMMLEKINSGAVWPDVWQPPKLSRLRALQWPVDYKDSGKV